MNVIRLWMAAFAVGMSLTVPAREDIGVGEHEDPLEAARAGCPKAPHQLGLCDLRCRDAEVDGCDSGETGRVSVPDQRTWVADSSARNW
jgi:hypothetical protein